MALFSSIISSAQVFLQDTAGTRYTSSQLMEYANEAVAEAKRIRPDLFFGSYNTPLSTYTTSSTVPLPVEYEAYLKDYIVSRAEMRDDEASNDVRSLAMMQRFRTGLLGV